MQVENFYIIRGVGMDNAKKNLLVLFPGKGYTTFAPLLYYAYSKYENKGYEIISLSYGSFDNIDDIRNFVLTQLNKVDFTIYDDIVFISKSMGTVIAGWFSEILNKHIRHILLTPLESTLQYIKSGKNISIVIAGTKDNLMDTNILMKQCKDEKIKFKLIEGADHKLEIHDEINMSIDILKQVIELY